MIGSLDALLIGGGFLIRFDKDVAPGYDPPTGIHHPTGYWLTPALLALQHGVPLIWNAPGMHCNDVPEWAQPLVRLALGRARYTAVRDEQSAHVLRTYAPDVEVVPDSGFGLAHVVEAASSADVEQPYIVVQAALGSQPFVQFVRRHPDVFAGRRFIALPIGPVLGDSARLLDGLSNLVTLDGWPHPLELAAIVRNAAAVVGHSYHLAISAMVAGVPVFTVDDLVDGKYSALSALGAIERLDMSDGAAAASFVGRLGRRPVVDGVASLVERVDEHWDRVATIVQEGRTRTDLDVSAFLQQLPVILEDAEGRTNHAVDRLAAVEAAHHRQLTMIAAGHAEMLVEERRKHDQLQREADAAVAAAHDSEVALAEQVDETRAALRRARLSTADALDIADAFRSSRSWRVTSPLRAVARVARRRRTTTSILDVRRLLRAELRSQPFEWAFIDGLFRDDDATALARTFPHDHFANIEAYGGEKDYRYDARELVRWGASEVVHPEALSDAWTRLASDLMAPSYRAALGALVGRDLTDCPLEVNVFHYGPDAMLGAHTDLPDKVVTHVMYFNREWDPSHGGTIAIQGDRAPSDHDVIVQPLVGNSVVLVRSDHSWHAVRPVVGAAPSSRRSITATFHQPGTSTSMWPVHEPRAVRDLPRR